MQIGALARASETPVATIRFYERAGLLPAPARTAGNFRRYDAQHAKRLGFIRRCRSLDISLDEIRVLLGYLDLPGEPCGEVNEVVDRHLAQVRKRMAELRMLERQLHDLQARCASPGAGRDCGILRELNQSGRAAVPAAPAACAGRQARPVQTKR
jgi:Cd(II)/Pb(II)-responsive transcriptional regulator